MPIVQHAVLNDLIFRVFHATGIPESDAYVVASHLVNSQLYGHDSHGTWFTPAYARGMYPPRIAEEGMIGMVWLNGGGVFLALFGSADRCLRPEPIAFSAPRRNGLPFVLDMTMTVVAGGKIE